jgi:single-strand DNA-binding protein
MHELETRNCFFDIPNKTIHKAGTAAPLLHWRKSTPHWSPGMAKSVNKVILIGNLGKDPEVKYTPQGTPVAKFSLATNERFKDKNGEWQDRTEWHNIVAWQRLAEIVGEYVKKGSKIYIEGSLRTSSWDDKQSGEKKYRTEIVANDLVLLGGRGEGDESHSGGRSRGAYAGGGASRDMDQRPQREDVAAGTTITDEDIPF